MTIGHQIVVPIRPSSTATEHAACLLRGLRSMVGHGIASDGLDADTCYLMGATIDTLIALVRSLDAQVAQAA